MRLSALVLSYLRHQENYIMKNNNTIRAKKFKVGSLYRNDVFPKALYLCVGSAIRESGEVKHKKKALVVIRDDGHAGNSLDNCEGCFVAAGAVKNWNWREV